MARLDVFRLASGTLVVDVQADLLRELHTRAVVPLLPQTGAPSPIVGLNPVFEIDAAPQILVTQAITAVSAKELRQPILSLNHHRDAILRALDILFTGV